MLSKEAGRGKQVAYVDRLSEIMHGLQCKKNTSTVLLDWGSLGTVWNAFCYLQLKGAYYGQLLSTWQAVQKRNTSCKNKTVTGVHRCYIQLFLIEYYEYFLNYIIIITINTPT